MKNVRLLLRTLILSFLVVGISYGQGGFGKIKGEVIDSETGDPVAFATVRLLQNGVPKGGAYTDAAGKFMIAPVQPGVYDVEVKWGDKTKKMEGIRVSANQTVPLKIEFNATVEVEEVLITEPAVKVDETVTGQVLSKEDIQRIATRDVTVNASLAAGAVQGDEGQTPSFRGGRAYSTQYFIDGVRAIGHVQLPQKAIGQMEVITGGTPAEFGDVTGGIISITTGAPSIVHNFGAELVSSQFTDPYNYNLLSLNGAGPLLTKKDSLGNVEISRLGYFFAGELTQVLDSDPSIITLKKTKDDYQKLLEETPLVPSHDGSFFINRASYTKADDLEDIKYKLNNDLFSYRFVGRLDIQLDKEGNAVLKIGGQAFNTIQNRWNVRYGFERSLFDYDNQIYYNEHTYRGYVRFQQRIPADTGSIFENIFYTIQADYTRNGYWYGDEDFGSNLFEYGHIGKFTGKRAEIFELITPSDPRHDPNLSSNPYWQTAGFADTAYYFDPSTSANPILANYNKVIYDYVARNLNPFPIFNFATLSNEYRPIVYNASQLRAMGGLLNGLNTPFATSTLNIYSLFFAQGTPYYTYGKGQDDQYRLTGQIVASTEKHNFKVGFEFDQRVERSYYISAYYLWQLMRQYANAHLQQLDVNNPIPVYANGLFQDTVRLRPLYDGAGQSYFDKQLRKKLGLPENSLDYINTDALDPSFYSLDMFSAEELFNAGNPILGYQGYTYFGDLDNTTSYQKFFEDTQNRPQPARRPTYMAGYIEDKFELSDIFVTLGLRVDRYDMNMPVLKDKYSLVPVYNAREASNILGIALPDNIGDDWVPYVDNKTNPTRFVGFRDGDFWYDANGTPISSELIAREGGGRVQPFVKQDSVVYESFTDYVPRVRMMPRISFSFPISDQATFFAHYDVLTQRPRGAVDVQMVDYLYLAANPTLPINNPDLGPEKTIDYEVGFKQALDEAKMVALSISAYYREMRDMIQQIRVNNAYPVSYFTFDNVDFGTSKGLALELDMRRVGLVRGRLSYTLQFAQGTGSSFGSSRNALNFLQGFSVLRIPLPLSFDQRHTIAANFDIRFDERRNKGPKISLGGKDIYPLKNFGVNLTASLASGRPYSRLLLPNPQDVQFGVQASPSIAGKVYGSRLPWTSRFDLRFEKDFVLKGKDKTDESGKVTKKGREYRFQVYLLFLNVLNTKNIVRVYRYTGSPEDSGYLSTGIGQQALESQFDIESFKYLYKIKELNPNNYRLPRRVRVGLQFFF